MSMAEVETQDVVSVGSRVSWGAVFAGAFVALTMCIFFGVLGAALNVTTTANTNVRPEHIATGSGIWTIVTLLLSLFVGGFVTSRATVGERKSETLMYGVLVWAVLVAMMVGVGAVGASATYGFGGYLREAGSFMNQPRAQAFTAEDFRNAKINVTTEELNRFNEQRAAARQATENVSATAAAWWAFAGIGLSLFAAILGALVGAGPELILRHWTGRRLVATPPPH
jgi:ABC-type transport system involved in multi-copper enzyme maturation permease subunit